jgi:hypothetical protein
MHCPIIDAVNGVYPDRVYVKIHHPVKGVGYEHFPETVRMFPSKFIALPHG